MKKIVLATLVIIGSALLTACIQQLPMPTSNITLEHNTSRYIKDIGTAD